MRRHIRLRVNSLEGRITPGAGQLDPSFSTDGIVTTRFPTPSGDDGRAIAIDSQGRILVAGNSYDGAHNNIAVTRYTESGALDMSFGGTGIVVFSFGSNDDYANGVTVDSFDRVVVVGYSGEYGAMRVWAVARLTVAGTLDTSFDTDGIQTIDFSGSNEEAYGVTVDAKDRILVAGSASGVNVDFAVTRLTPSGALDSSFDTDGKKTIEFSGSYGWAYGVAVDSLGRIVLGGRAYDPNTATNDFAVVRLIDTGELDAGFDTDGKQTIGFGAYSHDFAYGVAVDSLDRVVLAGAISNNDFAVARLTDVGALDSSFDTDGKQTIDFGATEFAYAVRVDSIGRIVVAGHTSNASYSELAVARLTLAGALDPSFDTDGKKTVVIGSPSPYVNSFGMAVDSIDRVVVATRKYDGSQLDFAIVRLTSAGALDTSFDADGIRIQNILSGSRGYGNSIAVDSLGRVVVAGYDYNTNYDFAITRYTASGALDTTFGGMGIVTVPIGAYGDYANGVAVDSSNRIVVVGYTEVGNNYTDFAVVRLTATGALDTSFDTDGKKTIDFGTFVPFPPYQNSADVAYGVAVDSMDRIVVVGSKTPAGSYSEFAVARLTPAGVLDTSFDTDGKANFKFNTSSDWAYSVAIDSVDRIIVAGLTNVYPDHYFAVARLTSSGIFDPNFDSDGKQTISFNGDAYGVAVDSKERVVVAGYTFNGSDFVIARLTAAGVLDNDFDTDGKQTVDFGSLNDIVRGVAVDSLDRVVVAGSTDNGPYSQFAIARLTAAGALDSNFDTDGKKTIAIGGLTDYANSVAVDALDRIVIAGTADLNGFEFAVARLTADTPPPQVVAITINNGSSQRSLVTSLKVSFDSKISFVGSPASAFQLNRQNDNALVMLSASVDASGTFVTLTFTGGAINPGGSLADGRYTLKILASQFSGLGFDGNGNGLANGSPADDYILVGSPANGLFRLFGDADGNGTVNSTDFATFRTFFGIGPSFFDFNNDGQTNSGDFAEFRKRFGLMI
jgi:uncharacterized delta-60 repeat protein